MISIKHLTKREKILAAAVLGFAVLTGAHQLVYRPLAGLLSNLDQQVLSTEAKMRKNLRLTQHADQINRQFEQLAPIYQFRGTDEEMVSASLRSIESFARTAAVTINDIKPQPGKEGPNQRKYLIEMDTEAFMPALFQFLQILETSPELFRVQKISLSPKGTDSKALRAHILVSRIVWT